VLRTVKLTYFRASGKYYSDNEFEVNEDLNLHEIWDKVEEMIRDKDMPGMSDGYYPAFTLVDVPGHPHEHPTLIKGVNFG